MEPLVAKQFRPARITDAESGLDASGRWRRLGAAITTALIVASLLALARYSNSQLTLSATETAEEEPVYMPDTRFLSLASMGYHNALADVLWFRTIDYFGKHFRGNRSYPWLARMCDVVTDLDPRAQHVYRFAGFILPWEAQTPDDGIRLLQKGVAQFPDSWQLQYNLGFTLYYFKDDAEGALRHLRAATELPDVHPYVAHLAATLAAQRFGADTAREFLEQLRESGGAGGMDGLISERLKDVELTGHLQQLEEAVNHYRERFGREPAGLDDLVSAGILSALPVEPFGNTYVYDGETREVRSSSGRRPLRLYDSARRQKLLSGGDYRE